MSKCALFASNTNQQAFVATGNTVNFGSIIRRFGNTIQLDGGNVEVLGGGYFEVDANVSFEATGAGDVTVQLYKDGVAITGATAIVTAEASTTYTVSIPAIVRQNFRCEQDTITAVISGVAGNVVNASIVVTKL